MASPLTPVGWAVLVTLVPAFLAAVILDWEEAGRITVMCVVLLVIAALFTIGRTRVEARIELHPQRVVVGERAGGRLEVHNPRARRVLASRIEVPIGAAVGRFDIPTLGPGASHDELFVVPTTRRAVIDVGPASSVRGDPVGLLRVERPWPGSEQIYVHPLTVRLDQLGTGFLRDLEGRPTSELSPSDVAFHTLREYVPGDDRRHIHWKTSARTGRLMVRQFVDTRRSHLAIGVSGDLEEYTDEDEFEMAISLSASLAIRTLLDEQDVTVMASGVQIATTSGQRMLDGFSGCDPGRARGDLMSTAHGLATLAPNASIAVFFCGSVRPLAAIRADLSRYSVDVRQIVVRTQVGVRTGMTQIGELRVLNIGQLADLPRALRLAGQQ